MWPGLLHGRPSVPGIAIVRNARLVAYNPLVVSTSLDMSAGKLDLCRSESSWERPPAESGCAPSRAKIKKLEGKLSRDAPKARHGIGQCLEWERYPLRLAWFGRSTSCQRPAQAKFPTDTRPLAMQGESRQKKRKKLFPGVELHGNDDRLCCCIGFQAFGVSLLRRKGLLPLDSF
jgi:hypothetical protein